MICPLCNGKLKVVDTRNIKKDNSIIRRKRCLHCGALYYTKEKEIDYVSIQKEWLKAVNEGRLKND
jgi:transcriptional regulator NrdR family protein